MGSGATIQNEVWIQLEYSHFVLKSSHSAAFAAQLIADVLRSGSKSLTERIPDALENTDQYILEKDILSHDDLDKEVLAGDLLEMLVNRFRGEVQDALGHLFE